MFTDGHATGFNIDVWESKMIKKLTANADYYPTEALRIAYVDSRIDEEAYKHLAARSRIGAWKLFATAKEMFEILQKVYGDVNRAHITMNKFWDLKMTKDFNSFWAKFQVLASELDYNKVILISELKFKLTLLLSRAMAGGVSWPTDIYEYAKQYQQMYQDLKNIKIWMPVANFAGNWYNRETKTNMSTNTNANTKTVNCSKHPVNSSYSWFFFMASNLIVTTHPARSKATRLTQKEIAKLQHEDRCFTSKEVGDHRPKCPNRWWLILVLTNADLALTWANVNKVVVPQPSHVEAENK